MLSHTRLIRQEMPSTTTSIYLNAGTFGPLPRCVPEAIQARIYDEWLYGRLGETAGFETIARNYQHARQRVTTLLNALPGEIALTDNTGDGMNIVSYGFAWQPGDEVITTNHEHISALAPLYQIRDRYGVTVHMADLGPNADQPAVEAIASLITPRTRLIVISHVTWTTGAVLDINAVGRLAHAHNLPVLVDGAQSAGNISIDVQALDVDFYAIPMQKWLCGPDGTGALYVRTSSLHYLTPTYVGYYSVKHEENSAWDLVENAQRFESGGRQTAAIAGQAAGLAWLETFVGHTWLFSRISQLNLYAYQALSQLPGVTILTPQPGATGILAFTLAGRNDGEMVQYLRSEYNITIRNIPSSGALRLSTGFYNTEEEIDTLVQALATLP